MLLYYQFILWNIYFCVYGIIKLDADRKTIWRQRDAVTSSGYVTILLYVVICHIINTILLSWITSVSLFRLITIIHSGHWHADNCPHWILFSVFIFPNESTYFILIESSTNTRCRSHSIHYVAQEYMLVT